jgi:hypothetical protein
MVAHLAVGGLDPGISVPAQALRLCRPRLWLTTLFLGPAPKRLLAFQAYYEGASPVQSTFIRKNLQALAKFERESLALAAQPRT